jgi:hypothetical protein
MVMPPRPAGRPNHEPVRPHMLNWVYIHARVQTNQRYNDAVRRYNSLVWELPMDRRHVFILPVDSWTGRPPVAGLPNKMGAIRQIVPPQWLAWAGPLNLAILPNDAPQQMIDRYLLWLGLPLRANTVRRA